MTDLEAEIDTLRELDALRIESGKLRDEGIEVLTTILKEDYKSDNPSEIARVSMALWELASHPPEKLNEWTKKLEGVELATIVENKLSILLAAEIMQALAAAPSFAFSKSSLYSYYLIIRELYTADAPSWVVGGARANPKGGMVSAYVTRECVRAIRSLARVLESTSNFIAKVGVIHKRFDLLQTSFPELRNWVVMEEARLKVDLHTTIQICDHLVFQPHKLLPDKLQEIDIKTVIEGIASELGGAATKANENFTNALKVIVYFRNKEKAQSKADEKERSRFIRTQAGHAAAMASLKRGLDTTVELIRILSSGPYKEFKEWEKLKEGVKEPITKIYELLHPVENFLSSVLDRELAEATGESYGGWDVVEMACSGAAYGAVAKEWDDNRLHRVADCLKKVVSDRGRFPIGRPFHAPAVDAYKYPDNTVAMGALAQILKKTAIHAQHLKQPLAIPAEQAFVKKMLYFFKDTRAHKPPVDMVWDTKEEETKYGWSYDYATPPCPTQPFATAVTVQLLGLINEMLDEQINAQILCHFFVRRPEELKRGPDLGTLFYPDYGLSLVAEPKTSRKDSIAILLQKMRAHVCGLQDLDPLYSLVLHGPQGTGKTTIVEALALSCAVPLVEVTPSDIVVRGQEAVERRARAAFEALSLLTRVVILFDEFDPVLWRRNPRIRPKDVFAFLIPGMLPKLRMLYKKAKRRSSAYVLITNLIGSLDEPTIRQGRFDKKIGIYPPDLLSRFGRFWSEAAVLIKEKDPLQVLPKHEDRLKKILVISSGAGMQAMNRKGNFRRPNEKESLGEGTLLHYYFYDGDEPEQLAKDASLKGVKVDNDDAKLEYQQWAWINKWDSEFCDKAGFEALGTPPPPVDVPTIPKAKEPHSS